MYKPYVLREEPFGYTFFDKPKLKHKFLLADELSSFYRKEKISPKEVTTLKINEKEYRKDIIYSPIRVFFELTLGCNLRCRYCFNNSGLPRSKELKTTETLRLLTSLRKCNVLDLRFSGGELTYRKNWFDILQYAKKLGFAVSCNTNANFDKNTIEKFCQLDPEQVTVSLDGNKKNHEYNRGKGTFEHTIRNIKLMHNMGLHLRINTLINKYSVEDVEFILDIAAKFAEEVNFFTIVYLGRGLYFGNTDGVKIKDHYRMTKKIEILKKRYPYLRVFCFSEVSRNTSVDKNYEKKFGLKIGPASGSTTFNISSHGYYSCGGYMPYIKQGLFLGNAKKQSIFQVWQRNRKLEKIREDSRKLFLFCNKCKEFRKSKCQGSKYEAELIRLAKPEIKNPTCILGEGPSLLKLC